MLALHQFVTGGAPSESERRLRLGALSDLDAAAIPAGLDYVALGHLHRPQPVAGAASPALYAGSPLAYSFSEAGQQKRAVKLVDAAPGRPAQISDIPLRGGRPLEIWAVSSLVEAQARAAAPRHRDAIVEVRAHLGHPLGASDGDALFALDGVTVLEVRDLFDAPLTDLGHGSDEAPEVQVEDLFRELWVKKHGEAPDDETMEELRSALLALGRDGESAA